jgi:hypothetical protein
LASTPVLGTGGRRFKSYHSDFALVTELADVLASETRFYGFDSHRGYCAPVAEGKTL